MTYEEKWRWICTPCNRHFSLDDPEVYKGEKPGVSPDPFINFCPFCGQQLELDDPGNVTLWGKPQPILPLNELSEVTK